MSEPIGAAFEKWQREQAGGPPGMEAAPAVDTDKELQIANRFVVRWEVFGSQQVDGVTMTPLLVQLQWMPSWRIRFLSRLLLGSKWTKLPTPKE